MIRQYRATALGSGAEMTFSGETLTIPFGQDTALPFAVAVKSVNRV